MKKRQVKKNARNSFIAPDVLRLAHKLYPIKPDKFFNHKITIDSSDKLTLHVWDNEQWRTAILEDSDTLKNVEQKLNKVKD